jgi:hypothetical protein
MGKGTGDHEIRTRSAISNLSIQTVDVAFPRTELAPFEEFLQEFNPFVELSFFKKINV